MSLIQPLVQTPIPAVDGSAPIGGSTIVGSVFGDPVSANNPTPNGRGTAAMSLVARGMGGKAILTGRGKGLASVTARGTGRVVGTGKGRAAASVRATGRGAALLHGRGIGLAAVTAVGRGRPVSTGRAKALVQLKGIAVGGTDRNLGAARMTLRADHNPRRAVHMNGVNAVTRLKSQPPGLVTMAPFRAGKADIAARPAATSAVRLSVGTATLSSSHVGTDQS